MDFHDPPALLGGAFSDDEFWTEVRSAEDRYARDDDERLRRVFREKRRRDETEVPLSILRALARTRELEMQDAPEGEGGRPGKTGRFEPGKFLQESLPDLVVVCTDHDGGCLKQDYWLGRRG